MITVENFKQYFVRDFPYLPYYNEEKIYFKGETVYSAPNFYQSLIDNNTQPLSDDQSWSAVRGDVNAYLTDDDIEKAIDQAQLRFPTNLFKPEERDIPELFLTAFYMVLDFKCSSTGINGNASSIGFTTSKSVGSVSESYSLPSWALNNPTYSIYTSNPYGIKYLSYLLPKVSLAGLGFLSNGATTL